MPKAKPSHRRRTVALTLTPSPIVYGALAALARLAGDDKAGRALAALLHHYVETRAPGAWGRAALRLNALSSPSPGAAEGWAPPDPSELAAAARDAFLEALAGTGAG